NKNGSPSNKSDLANHNYIPHKSRVTPLVNIKKNKLNPQTIPSNISANNIEFKKASVLNEFGISQFHEYIVKNQIQKSQL
ncbi:LysR family transcriptional regulator, partial [Francisella tularensis subsp. holarctica]|nr:LysR family transcriptional regulator [Francisella tularensis subsp. holarctica]